MPQLVGAKGRARGGAEAGGLGIGALMIGPGGFAPHGARAAAAGRHATAVHQDADSVMGPFALSKAGKGAYVGPDGKLDLLGRT